MKCNNKRSLFAIDQYNKIYNYKTALGLAFMVTITINLVFLLVILLKGPKAHPPGNEIQIIAPFNLIIVNVIDNFLLSFCLYFLNFQILKRSYSAVKRLFLTIVLSFVAATIISYTFSTIESVFIFAFKNPDRHIFGSMFRDLFITIIILFTSHIIYLYTQRQKTLIENEKLLSENIRTRYEVLKNQMDPHFLFNALNTLHSLIKIDTDKAQEYVQQLSLVFRYTMQNKETTTLEDEIKFTNSYCHLMKIRYGESLQFEYRIDEKYNSALVVPLSLQTLVENAIKHNVITKKQPLVITISTNSEHNLLVVTNPIQPKKESMGGSQVGLANLRERYQLMWKTDIQITATEEVFRVELPLQF